MRKCWKSKALCCVVCTLLIVASMAITYINWICTQYQIVHTTTKVTLWGMLTYLSTNITDSDIMWMFISPKELDTPTDTPEKATTIHTDGFYITFPFELVPNEEKSEESFRYYQTNDHLCISHMQALQEVDDFMFGKSYSESMLSSVLTMPRHFWLANSPIQLNESYMYLNMKAIQEVRCYATYDDIIAYTDQKTDTLLIIHTCNTSTLLTQYILIDNRDANRSLTEEEIAYILNHIELAPQWEED